MNYLKFCSYADFVKVYKNKNFYSKSIIKMRKQKMF